MIIGNIEVKPTKERPVEVNGRLYWPTFHDAKAHRTRESGCWVIRWVAAPGKYTTLYC